MNKEEIDKIRKKYKTTKDAFIDEKYDSIRLDVSILKDFEILLNYIDKLQKENAELKEEIKDLIEENHKHIDYIADMKKKHEDKIRTKIKELEKEMNREDIQEEHFWCVEAERSVLVELLGE